MAEIATNLAEVRQRVAAAAQRAGREPDEVELLVVSKTWPAGIVREVVEAGQCALGENKVQEAEGKVPLLPGHVRWHLIGPLQRNKVRKALPLFEVLHGITSLKLAEAVNRVAGELGMYPKIYLQVNVGEEEGKSGFTGEVIRAELGKILALERLDVLGLMAIPPAEEDPDNARQWFVQLRELRDDLVEREGVPLSGLSMGMSHDYEVAIEEGATVVRVGSAIFGARSRKARMEAEEL